MGKDVLQGFNQTYISIKYHQMREKFNKLSIREKAGISI